MYRQTHAFRRLYLTSNSSVLTESALHASDQLFCKQTQRKLRAGRDRWQRQQEVDQLVHRVPPQQRLRRGQVLGWRLCTCGVCTNRRKHTFNTVERWHMFWLTCCCDEREDELYDNATPQTQTTRVHICWWALLYNPHGSQTIHKWTRIELM